jgi:hypothetical protein
LRSPGVPECFQDGSPWKLSTALLIVEFSHAW